MIHRPTTDRRRGMTLVELIVVVGLIGVMFGVIFFRLDFMVPGQRLKSSARQLASHLEQMYNYCVVSGHPIRFEYDLDNRAYRAFHPFEFEEDGKTIKGEGETDLLQWTQFVDTIYIADVTIGDGSPLTSGVVFAMFEPRGVATGHSIHLMRGETEYFYSVLVNPLFGYVDMERGYRQPEELDDSHLRN